MQKTECINVNLYDKTSQLKKEFLCFWMCYFVLFVSAA